MKTAKASLTTLGLLALTAIASSVALADDAGWYIGGNLGQSRARIDDGKIASSLAASGLTMTSISENDHEIGYKLFGGFQFNRYFALEGGYFDMGKFGYTAKTSPPGSLSGNLKLSGVFLDPVGFLPLTERLSAFGRVGVNYAEAKADYSATGSVSAPAGSKKSSANFKFGVGLQYALTRNLALRVEAERYRIDDSVGANNEGDIDLASLGLVYRFASDAPVAAPVAASPPPPAPPPAPEAPPPARVPPPVTTARYCTFLDIAFEINKGTIQREEKERLAVVGTFLTKYPDTTAIIEGHTDNVGSDAFNQKLSQQRAESVVRYLVDELRIAPSRLSAVGYGKTRPIADNKTSEGKRANRRINAVIRCARDFQGLTVVPARLTMALEMEFDPLSSEIEPEYRDELIEVADFMKKHPSVTATVEGHAGTSVGTGAKEVKLSRAVAMQVSKRRAQNVVNYLVDRLGVARSRLSAEGFGHSRRVTYGATAAEQQENRRVNIIFMYPKS